MKGVGIKGWVPLREEIIGASHHAKELAEKLETDTARCPGGWYKIRKKGTGPPEQISSTQWCTSNSMTRRCWKMTAETFSLICHMILHTYIITAVRRRKIHH